MERSFPTLSSLIEILQCLTQKHSVMTSKKTPESALALPSNALDFRILIRDRFSLALVFLNFPPSTFLGKCGEFSSHWANLSGHPHFQFRGVINHRENEVFEFKVDSKWKVNTVRTRTKLSNRTRQKKSYLLCSMMGANHSLQIGLLITERM